MTAALYLRQSLDKTGLEAAVDRQRDETITHILHNLDTTTAWREYKDNDTSAYNLRKPRPEYQRLLADIRRGEIKLITCWHPDRLYRRVRDLLELIDVCEAHQVQIRTVRAGHIDLSTPTGRTQAKLAAVISEGEMETKADRQKAMHRQRRKQGKSWWVRRPFGYQDKHHEEHEGRWKNITEVQLHPEEAPLLREAYEKVLAGISCHSIMQQWNKQGITTTTGAQWRNNKLARTLLAPRNAALIENDGQLQPTTDWPPIVTEDIYQSVKTIIENPERDKFTVNGRTRKYLLVGIATCGHCGHTVRPATSRQHTINYRCTNCYKIWRQQQPVDDAITRLIAARLSQPDAHNLLADHTIDTTALRAETARLRERRTKARNDYKQELIDGNLYKETTDEIDQQLATINQQMTDANKARIFAGIIGADNVAEAFNNKPLDQRRAIIEHLLHIEIHPGHRGQPLTPATLPVILKVTWKPQG